MFVTYCEKHKVLLVVLPNAVINPGAVMVHFPYAAFTNTEQKQTKNKTSLACETLKCKTFSELLQQQGQTCCSAK